MDAPPPASTLPAKRKLQFQDAYVWFVFVASLDIMFTWIVLFHRGAEVNPLANAILHHFGRTGLVFFKFAIVVFVILLCEIIGRRNRFAAQMLVGIAIALTTLPILVAILQLLVQKYLHLQ